MKQKGSQDLEECYFIAANIVQRYGEKYLPIFKRLHAERESSMADLEILRLAIQLTKRVELTGRL